MAKKWLDSIKKQKKKKQCSCDEQTDGQMDRQTESTTKINKIPRLGAEISIHQTYTNNALWYRDECIKFCRQKVKVTVG